MNKALKSGAPAAFPLATVLGIAFIVLKITDYIDWSWWWVLSPFWIPPAIFFVVASAALGVIALFTLLAALFGRRIRRR